MAERVGFEPTVRLPVHRISSAAHSTSLPPLREVAAGRGLPVRSKKRAVSPCFAACQALVSQKPWTPAAATLFRLIAVPILHSMDRSTFFSPQAGRRIDAPTQTRARFGIGDVVRHKIYDFRGVVFDIDPVFANSEEWYESITKEVRPAREQPFYHLLAENGDSSYIAYVSQQNLAEDGDSGPVDHPNVAELFEDFDKGRYRLRRSMTH